MTEEEFKALNKASKRAKRIASEKAMELHDLVEDRLPAAFEELPQLTDETYAACKLWAKAERAFNQAEREMKNTEEKEGGS